MSDFDKAFQDSRSGGPLAPYPNTGAGVAGHNAGLQAKAQSDAALAPPVSGGGGGAPFLERPERRVLQIGFVIGFLIGYLPFFVKGMGFYSSYPFKVGGELGLYVGGFLCCLKLLQRSKPLKMVIVAAGLFFLWRFLSPVPLVSLFEHIY